jgi:hypothetical protein
MRSDHTTPTVAAMLGDAVSLLCCMAFYGPPVVFLVAPWLVLGLILSGPFAVILTLVAALLVAGALAIGIGMLCVAPLLMLRGRREALAPTARPVPVRMPVAARWVTA